MRRVETEVLVIGGGATGTGVLRDLAMRGFKAILVEKRDLTNGTTGRYHGLLHSGARYAVRDTATAVECIQENRILRRIMPHCIEDSGGFFVTTPWDDTEYAPQFVEGCRKAGIPVEEVPIGRMLREEPLLNPRIVRCLRVPDGCADSFRAAEVNVASARDHGGQAWTYHPVERLLVDAARGRVIGALCRDLVKDEEVTIQADLVVNAGGAWAGQIAALAGLGVPVLCGKGSMVALNHRVLNTVVSRCRPPADGDIIVPAHTVAVIGTTDVKVDDPDRYTIEPWEMQLMWDEGEKILPGLKDMRILRAWAGVRPLYQAVPAEGDRSVSRGHALLDHAARDGVAGMLTIVGGKWTTYRLMAQDVVDRACVLLGTSRECRTHLEPLPAPEGSLTHHVLGAPLARVEDAHSAHELVCECELATRADVERSIATGEVRTIDDIRRDVRLGMGPCQGAFCTYRAAGMLHAVRRPPPNEAPKSIPLANTGDYRGTCRGLLPAEGSWRAVEHSHAALRDFLEERWKGLRPVLSGDQLRQLRLNELIYRDVLNVDRLDAGVANAK